MIDFFTERRQRNQVIRKQRPSEKTLGRMEGWLTPRLRTCVMFSITLLLSTTVIIVKAAPVLGPDLASCRPVIPYHRTAAESVSCCLLNTGRPIVDFKYNPDLPMRVRRSIHTLDDEFVRKYERAMALMRALPPDDPRSWHAQANLHCSYCSKAYNQFDSITTLSIHHGWFVLPFHRWYVYFHERILASLIEDDSFAIPYWAWDVQNATDPPANIMPETFMNPFSPLYNPHRSHVHCPPHRVDLVPQAEPHNKDPEELLKSNYFQMWRVMRGETKTASAFLGGKVSKGDNTLKAGQFENGPHAAVHFWTGDELTIGRQDMGPSYSAARDPLFYNHHAQVDRLWVLWKLMGGKDHEDLDWLDSEFLFYDENADLVRVKIRDCLDNEKLRVSYESVAAEWQDHLHPPHSIRNRGDPKYKRKGQWEQLWKHLSQGQFREMGGMLKSAVALLKGEERMMLKSGRKVVTTTVARPEASLRRNVVMEGQNSPNSEAVEFDEVLLISGKVTKPFDIAIVFNIFVELPEADETTPLDCAESLGGIYIEAEGPSGDEIMVTRDFSNVIGMGDRFQSLDIRSRMASRLSFTFVPAWKALYDASVSVDITELKMELHRL